MSNNKYKLRFLLAVEDKYPCVLTPAYVELGGDEEILYIVSTKLDSINTVYSMNAIGSISQVKSSGRFCPIIDINDDSAFSRNITAVGRERLYAFAFSSKPADIFVGNYSSFQVYFEDIFSVHSDLENILDNLENYKKYEIYELVQYKPKLILLYKYIVSHKSEFIDAVVLHAEQQLRLENADSSDESAIIGEDVARIQEKAASQPKQSMVPQIVASPIELELIKIDIIKVFKRLEELDESTKIHFISILQASYDCVEKMLVNSYKYFSNYHKSPQLSSTLSSASDSLKM